jgi:signal transduction histidine kinase
LASIQGAVSALDHSGTADETCRELRQIILKECGRLRHLLTGLLDFARPRPAEYRTVDVTQMLNSVIALVVHAAAKNGVTLRQEVAPVITSLECDPEQLTQVILNLALNAIQAMPGGGEIVLSACREGSNVVVQVRDQGVGIDAGNLDRIFDPFFTTKENGTGLGLAVAHRIVNQHGGGIKVEENADKGMSFTVSLPLRRLERVCAEEANASGSRNPSDEVWVSR